MKWTHSKLYANIYDQDGRHVAAITGRPEREANARLIAAAPDLLAACKFAASVMNANFPTEASEFAAIDKLQEAIGRAKGDEHVSD
jgi:hypothetical protein